MGVVASFVVTVLACSPPPPRASDAARDITPSGLPTHLTSDGVALAPVCTPSGEELCFNAIDDNCNGVIDEGCGLCTGPLQFTIAWGDSPANVDLHVFDPNGGHVHDTTRTSPSGLKLDHDCPDDRECNGQNVENVCFEGEDPPRGHYGVEIRLAKLNHAPTPVKVDLGARVGSRSFSAHVELTQEGEKKGFTFDL